MLGLVRTDLNTPGTSFKNGIPVTAPINFGQGMTGPFVFGATINPTVTTSTNGNPMTIPHNFGNQNPPTS